MSTSHMYLTVKIIVYTGYSEQIWRFVLVPIFKEVHNTIVNGQRRWIA